MDHPDLSIETRRTDAEAVVTVIGEIDLSTTSRLSRAVDEVLATDPPPQVLLDLAGVTFCDSQGLGTLVVLSRRLEFAQRRLILVNVREFLLRVINITGLNGALVVRGSPVRADHP